MRFYTVAQADLEVTVKLRSASHLRQLCLNVPHVGISAVSDHTWLPTFDVKQAIKSNFPSYKTGFTWPTVARGSHLLYQLLGKLMTAKLI